MQIPLVMGQAMTTYSCQGQTMDGVIVNLAKPLRIHNVYVALSRVRRLSYLTVLDIDHTALKQMTFTDDYLKMKPHLDGLHLSTLKELPPSALAPAFAINPHQFGTAMSLPCAVPPPTLSRGRQPAIYPPAPPPAPRRGPQPSSPSTQVWPSACPLPYCTSTRTHSCPQCNHRIHWAPAAACPQM